MTKTAINSIHIPDEFYDLCLTWYGGQDTMMYAIVSTGELRTGGVRPYDSYEDRFYTDEEWYVNLFVQLEVEIYQFLKLNSPAVDEDRHNLTEFQKWTEGIIERLKNEYGLD